MKQEQNCAVWSWNYPGFPSPDGESIVISMGAPLGSLGTGTCDIWKPILLQSFQHFSSRAPERAEMGFPSKILGKGNNKDDLKDSADFLLNPSKSASKPELHVQQGELHHRQSKPLLFYYHKSDTSREQNQRINCINSHLLPLAISHPSRTT